MPVQLNSTARDHAQDLIDEDQYVKDSDWSEAQPSASDENDFIERNGWDAYAAWHLAEDTDENEQTKGRYAFPVGDFRRVHRSGLIAAKQRAGEWGHDDVEQAADALLADVPAE